MTKGFEYTEPGAFTEEQVPAVTWGKPELAEREFGEIFRAAKDLSECPEEATDVALRMYESFFEGQLEALPEDLWAVLENTDSYGIERGGVASLRHLAEENKRDADFQLNRMRSGDSVPAPTIVIYKGRAHKVGGNTRLGAARVLGISPQVMIARLDTREPSNLVLNADAFAQITEFYEWVRLNKTREEFENLLTTFGVETITQEEIWVAHELADLYYRTEPRPALKDLAEKARHQGIL